MDPDSMVEMMYSLLASLIPKDTRTSQLTQEHFPANKVEALRAVRNECGEGFDRLLDVAATATSVDINAGASLDRFLDVSNIAASLLPVDVSAMDSFFQSLSRILRDESGHAVDGNHAALIRECVKQATSAETIDRGYEARNAVDESLVELIKECVKQTTPGAVSGERRAATVETKDVALNKSSCQVCHRVRKEMVQLYCSHVFCVKCIVKKGKSGSQCPICQQELCLDVHFPSHLTKKYFKKQDECFWCRKKGPRSSMNACDVCYPAGDTFSYCSKECQRAAWPVHKRTARTHCKDGN